MDDNNGGLVSQGLSVVLTDDRTEDFDGDGLTESEEDTYEQVIQIPIRITISWMIIRR